MNEPEKKADLTRARILQAAFDEIHTHGYQGMRVDAILSKHGLTKGALYHHFPNKLSLGYAVVDEFLRARFRPVVELLETEADPIDALCQVLTTLNQAMSDSDLERGCPVNNLTQEMAGLDEGFKQRLHDIYEEKINVIADALRRGQHRGIVRNDVDVVSAATFIISALQGIRGITKCLGKRGLLRSLGQELCLYLQSLRAEQDRDLR